ncbi:hypothetical protein [Paenibacillus sp. Mc5Re-14]|uniref:hypothetical protein n=1 Tax=Paenibacillus sp. Mc5Re-14 TaxID=1030529 RepID=UPI000A79166D|nr:hypothetical protein [Paenibacillus sp. Mc5Re-14]
MTVQLKKIKLIDWVEITKHVTVKAVYYVDGTCECAVMTKWFKFDDWSIEEDYVKPRKNMSPMEVYGYIEYEVKPAYLEN